MMNILYWFNQMYTSFCSDHHVTMSHDSGRHQVYRYTVLSKNVLVGDESELYELATLAGVVVDPNVFKIIVDLLRMNVAPSAIERMLKSMVSSVSSASSGGENLLAVAGKCPAPPPLIFLKKGGGKKGPLLGGKNPPKKKGALGKKKGKKFFFFLGALFFPPPFPKIFFKKIFLGKKRVFLKKKKPGPWVF
ncbi:hypothetical protein NP493_4657g00003 [Ridgeia piscesae]|uniref:Uncharacterized protein n=1 Tax=Ridgeia piscesae TaxID=27915 RepID=A0AAD9IZ93_RIDPI|nr:hypothetical protein NP493_4657g00003 [Ridgeia piscesae]